MCGHGHFRGHCSTNQQQACKTEVFNNSVLRPSSLVVQMWILVMMEYSTKNTIHIQMYTVFNSFMQDWYFATYLFKQNSLFYYFVPLGLGLWCLMPHSTIFQFVPLKTTDICIRSKVQWRFHKMCPLLFFIFKVSISSLNIWK